MASAYGGALLMAAALVGGGGGAAIWFRTHPGAPPPIVVVAQAPPVATTPPPVTTGPTTTTKPPGLRETIPSQVPDELAYTAPVPSELPDFPNHSATNYGWFGGDSVSARCDEWRHATVVGSTVETLFVVCGSYFKAYRLDVATPIRTPVSGSGERWSGSGGGVSIELSRTELAITQADGTRVTQSVLEWWRS
ncbi:hypothetical protein HLB23_14010 [Nocardia uniformis]|uniref:Uncharacterized protein n=1 Tax=Nocardia uniformis TaxID=53432 RepID=A0A849BWJ0_9NOCA|nr:hypothetical protein [Nocardia uniformis]NNH70963.1 hypothetical protein [Nocardia uniformis]